MTSDKWKWEYIEAGDSPGSFKVSSEKFELFWKVCLKGLALSTFILLVISGISCLFLPQLGLALIFLTMVFSLYMTITLPRWKHDFYIKYCEKYIEK